MRRTAARPPQQRLDQRGQVLLILLVILVIGVGAAFYTFVGPPGSTVERDKITAASLAQARDALIGYAAAVNTTGVPSLPPPPNPRLGELPCPNRTTLSDGTPSGIATTPCSGLAARVGWLPWKTLGLPPLRDGSGEYLWYAVSDTFKNNPRTSGSILNSDTPGDFTITGTTSANSIIAIVFAPGGVTDTQNRDNTVTACTTTGTNISRRLCAANYLEGENADSANNTFETRLPTDLFNDQLLPVTSDALFSVINMRVAKEAISALESYRSTNGYYPSANAYGSAPPYYCSPGTNRGRFPITTVGGSCGQAAWPANALPAWFAENNWNLVTHYGMSKACGQLAYLPALNTFVWGSLCGQPANIASVNSVLLSFGYSSFTDQPLNVAVTNGNNTRTLVIVTGRALGTQVHTCTSIGQCLEDAANADGDINYVKPSRFPASNDQMAICSSISCPAIP